MAVDNVSIENFEWKKHYLRLAPMVVRYFREVNAENLEEESPVLMNGTWIGIKKVDAKLQSLLYEGIFCKVAIVDEEIVGFIWYKDLFRAMVVGIEAFYVARAFRKEKVGQALVNSFANEFNQGQFRIYATYHARNEPKEMLAVFHGWEKCRDTNDRDLVMIRGEWNMKEQESERALFPRKLG